MNALAIGIEQATKELLPISELNAYAERLSHVLDHLHYRVLPDNTKIWTLGIKLKPPIIVQIVCSADDYVAQRIAMVLYIILLGNWYLLEKVVTDLGGNKEDCFNLRLVTENEFRKNLPDLSLPDKHPDIASTISESNVSWDQEQPPSILILHDDYDLLNNWVDHPNNLVFVWLLMNVYRVFVSHSTHQNRKDTGQLAKNARKFCEAVLQ
jgi:hypothetical protein